MKLPARFLKPVTVRREGQMVMPAGPGGADENGNPTPGTPAKVGEAFEGTFQGLIQPNRRRVQAGATGGAGGDLALPAFLAYLPIEAPVDKPGFTLLQDGVEYAPLEDAANVAGVDGYWLIPCRNARSREG